MGRNKFSPHPSMGLPPGWNVGDLPRSYSTPNKVVNAVTANSTSTAFNPEANTVELYAQFSDGATSCSVTLLNDDGTGTFVAIKTFDGVNLFNCSNLVVGEWPTDVSLAGRQCKIQISNYSGTGTITVLCTRLN